MLAAGLKLGVQVCGVRGDGAGDEVQVPGGRQAGDHVFFDPALVPPPCDLEVAVLHRGVEEDQTRTRRKRGRAGGGLLTSPQPRFHWFARSCG